MIQLARPAIAPRKPLVWNRQVQRALRPRPRVDSWDWINKHGRDSKGRLFDGEKMPWLKGVCESWDDPNVRKIVLMWGTRLGKTLGSHELMACAMSNNPMPGIYATATDKLAKRTVREKIYKILEQVKQTRWQLLPEKFRSTSELRLKESTWVVAYSGSETLLADWPGFYGIANEVDKWDKSESTEGDTLAQFFERFKDSPSHKILVECSPSIKDRSRIEAEYLQSDMRRYFVPCPHCKHHQVLRMGSGQTGEGGLRWDKPKDGESTADVAERTARYICEQCGKSIYDRHRPNMMRCGVWAPKGCTVDKKGKLCGKVERTCSVAGFRLSSLYSLQLTWGKIAAAFTTMRRNPKTLQMFINGWLAETWEPYRIKSEPEDVADRLSTDDKPGVIPKWATWLFSAVDVQAEYFKWMKVAAGPGERVSIVDRGICDTWEEVFEHCVNQPVPHADGGPALLPCLTLIDSGDGKKTDEVYRKCREWSRLDRLVLPCKGANTDSGSSYEKSVKVPEKHNSRSLKRQALRAQGAVVIRVNSFWHEPIIQRWLDARKPDDADSLSIPRELADDLEFMRELCNAVQSDDPSKMDPDRLLWKKRWESEANDFRDTLKYCRCAIDVKFRGNWRVAERRQLGATEAPPAPRRRELQTVGAESSRPHHGRRISLKRWRPKR
jgi:phage terminase large subunit GpA-like protein